MSKTHSFYDTVDQMVTYGVSKGILHLHNEDEFFQGNHILLSGRQVVNFGSCSYLGLEFDERLRQGAKEAIDFYGTQFSESRAYVSLKPYKELETLLNQVFDAHCVITPTTTLGHIAAIPVLVEDSDAVIMDHQVHNSVQTAVQLLKARGVQVELLRHNRIDLLEERVKVLRLRHRKIWYMADGIYSMYGDSSPVDEIYQLMDHYPELYYYVDDAHGMSIFGKNGRGSVLNDRPMHPRMALAASLNKAFAAGGGVMVYPNSEMARRVRTCGGPMITSGPMQPSGLGAALASAKIHLSQDIYEMQEDLMDKLMYTKLMIRKYGLPLISDSKASVFFIGVSLPKLGYNLVKRMLERGYYVNLGIFPAVPLKNTGIRFTITRLHTYAQIESMIATMAEEFPKALKEEGMTLEQIYKAFRLPLPEEKLVDQAVASVIHQTLSLHLDHKQSIEQIGKEEWDQLFKGKGTFDWEGLKTLEESFSGNERPEDNWMFDYLLVRDTNNEVVAATFLTTTLWKDDMLSPSAVSTRVERERLNDPYFLTSKVISSGSLLTEGEHIYINKSCSYWKDAIHLIFERINLLQEKYEASQVVLREFHSIDKELDDMMVDNGYFRYAMPDTYHVHSIDWKNKEEFYQNLSKCSREHFRKKVRRYEHCFDVEVMKSATAEEIDCWYQLYRNVKQHSLELNTFALPKKLFNKLLLNHNWEAITLKLNCTENKKIVGVVFCYRSADCYVPMIIGMDYEYNGQFQIYRQALYQIALRAATLGMERLNLGFSAGVEKKKVGANAVSVYAYMNSKDSYNHQVLAEMNKVGQTTNIG